MVNNARHGFSPLPSFSQDIPGAAALRCVVSTIDFDAADSANHGSLMSGSEIDTRGFGVVQSVDAAATDLYVCYRNFGADVFTSPIGVGAG